MLRLTALTVLLATVQLAAVPAGGTQSGTNLVRNPGAEDSPGAACTDPTAFSPPAGWQVTGKLTALRNDCPPVIGGVAGSQLFTGGANRGLSTATQDVDLGAYAAAIDGGGAQATLSGLLGGWQGQRDYATVQATFLDAAGRALGSLKIGPVTVEERNSQTVVLPRSAGGTVPRGARRARLVLSAVYLDGAVYNDGYADNISLTVRAGTPAPAPPPQPPAAGRLSFTWKIPDRFGLDADGDGLIDYATTPAEVGPALWPVAVHVTSCDPSSAYVFSTGGRSLRSSEDDRAGPCWFRVLFPKQGRYTLKATGISPTGKRAQGSRVVVVKDWLVVGIGDSAGSGEGAPDVPGATDATWEFERCHRSARSFEAQTALSLERASDYSSVTFVHLACSGAGIKAGALGGYFGIAPGGAREPLIAQIADAKRLTANRKVDGVIVSIGVNDIGFGAVIKFCAAFPDCMNHAYQGTRPLRDVIEERLGKLRHTLYPQLAARLRTLAPPGRVYITEYFDPLRDDDGIYCDAVVSGIDQHEVEGLGGVLGELNDAVREAASANGWHYVGGIEGAFREHGYCASDNWIVTLTESLRTQGGSIEGTLHPNPAGYRAIARLVFPVVYANVKAIAPGA